jgi:hypothetical protein
MRKKRVLKHKEDIFKTLSYLYLYLLKKLHNRYSYIIEVILYNIHIITDYINILLSKHFEFFYNKILVFILLFLNELLKHVKVLLNKIEVKRV